MTNRVATDGTEGLIVPLEPPGRDGRRGVAIHFPGDLTVEEWERVESVVRSHLADRERRSPGASQPG